MEKIELLENKGIMVFDLNGMLNAYPMKSEKAEIKVVCNNLIKYSFEKGLLKNTPYNNKDELNDNLIIYQNDLTEKGKMVFNDLMFDWLRYTDNKIGNVDRKNNIKMLDKYFSKIINNKNIEEN